MASTSLSSKAMLRLSVCRPAILLVQSVTDYYAAQAKVTAEQRKQMSDMRYAQILAGRPYLDYFGNTRETSKGQVVH